MPRNRTRRPPAAPVAAKADKLGALRCGHCGQAIPLTFDPNASGPMLQVLSINAWGWRFDGDVWRPTAENRRRWLHARDVVRRPDAYSARHVDEARKRIERGSYQRPDDRPADDPPHDLAARRRFALPARIECIACDAINVVAAPEL